MEFVVIVPLSAHNDDYEKPWLKSRKNGFAGFRAVS